jgi:hypothetical protein
MNKMNSDAQVLLNVAAKVLATPAPAPPTSEPRKTVKKSLTWDIPGFCGKSKIATSFGNLPIEALRRNDPVKIASGDFRKIVWVDKITLDPEFLTTHPEAQPVLIRAGSLGPGKPAVDMFVSPAQLVQSSGSHGKIAYKNAAGLITCGSAVAKPQASITYYVFACSQEVSVCVDGLWCEIAAQPSRDS